jgi:hypothetical protein
MKAIRELAMCEVWGGGRLMLHAAAYASGGNGCLILGPKGAGKTTLLTYLLHCGSARYVTNDRAAVVKGENGFSIHGIPTIVSLRSGTTGYFPKLREGQQDRAYRQLQTLAEAHEAAVPSELPRQMIDHPDLSPAQYTTHLACATDGAAHLAAVLVPNIRTDHDGLGGRGYRITRLDLDCARTAIHNALFGPEGACPGGGLLPAAVPMAADLADRRSAILNDLSRFIPCFQVDIHETAYATSNLADALSLLAGASDHPAERRSIS